MATKSTAVNNAQHGADSTGEAHYAYSVKGGWVFSSKEFFEALSPRPLNFVECQPAVTKATGLNTLTRFRRMSVQDDWPQCVICREPVSAGLELCLHEHSAPQFIVLCDNCVMLSKKLHPHPVREKT